MKPSTISALLLTLSLSALSAQALPIRSNISDHTLTSVENQAFNTVTVIDQNNQPIIGAEVLIGFAPGNPVSDNIKFTDYNGQVKAPSDWLETLPVTVKSAYHVRTTYTQLDESGVIRMNEKDGTEHIELGGTTTDYGRLKRDGWVDFGLVIPAFTREGLLHFDVSSVISPEVDTISILGKRVELPSNLSLPKQRESYVFPITLDKPDYRVYVRKPGLHRLIATHGRFPLRDVIDDVRGGDSMFKVVNRFDFIGGGTIQMEVSKYGGKKDISINEIIYNSSVEITGPQIPDGHEMISMSLADQDGFLFPTDVKRVQTGETITLKTVGAGLNKHLVSVLVNGEELENRRQSATEAQSDSFSVPSYLVRALQAENNDSLARLSFVLQDANTNTSPRFLPLIEPPKVEGTHLLLEPPHQMAGITPVATYVILSEVESIERGKVKSERRTRIWELRTSSWVDGIELPQMELERRPDREYRWEVMFLGRRSSSLTPASTQAGSLDFNDITHITRNAVDF